MSSNTSPLEGQPVSPYVATTTPNIERANRLMSLRSHPGFLDLLRLSQELVDTTTAILVDYGGWDAQQITVLKVRAQAAKEHHNLLIARMQEAIQLGITESRDLSSTLPAKSAEDAVDQGDLVRQRVLQNFEEQDNRLPGSY